MSAFHRVITLTVSKVGRRKERGTKELRINWERGTGEKKTGEERKITVYLLYFDPSLLQTDENRLQSSYLHDK